MYIAHKRKDGVTQPLRAHLTDTGDRAASFAASFGANDHARRTGMLHDVGKYGERQQQRMNDPEHVAKVDHSSAGAQVAKGLRDLCAAFAIAGHHGGLPDAGSPKAPEDGTLAARLCKTGLGEYGAYAADGVAIEERVREPEWVGQPLSPKARRYPATVYTRMLFSCLVDADFLDTEAFMGEQPVGRGGYPLIEKLLEKLSQYIGEKGYLGSAEGRADDLNARRSDILRQCLRGGERPGGLYTLTVPTGGGKTVSSLAFALTHAKAHGKRRVIYVVPYTSIIDQTSRTFREILGDDNVLEHHANVDFADDPDDAERPKARKRLAAENWDAPVIVTTAVQFFESFYGAKPSKCRKLHNVANSVVVFDEAQMMPTDHLVPCVAAIAELVRHYHATAVLCTATQPSLGPLLTEFGCASTELIDRADELYERFRRVTFSREGLLDEDELCRRLCAEGSALCIVNTRAQAQRIYERLPTSSRFHLSTLMTPRDRERVLDIVRARLKRDEPCHVISTSLIEAGVDVDFPSVWREEAGLDSILQSAGRCNREGRRDREKSVVHVFATGERIMPMMSKQVSAMRVAMETNDEMDGGAAVKAYFDVLIRLKGSAVDSQDIMGLSEQMAFRTIAERFHMIDSATVAIVIPNDENAALTDALKRGFYNRDTLRQIGRDSVNVYRGHYLALLSNGKLLDVEPGSLSILTDAAEYDPERGLSLKSDTGAALFV